LKRCPADARCSFLGNLWALLQTFVEFEARHTFRMMFVCRKYYEIASSNSGDRYLCNTAGSDPSMAYLHRLRFSFPRVRLRVSWSRARA
jgi:hypothetical protein